MGRKMPLYMPLSYIDASEEERAKVCNGCGAKDGIKVPDRFYGLKIKDACQIHDWMFEIGTTRGDYIFSNLIFFWNMVAISITHSNRFMMFFRCERALKYFIAVMFNSGKSAFWTNTPENKNKTITIKGKFV